MTDESTDLTQFYEVFFEEAAEHLDRMESLLVGLDDVSAADAEQLNAIFRAAHSIKGGAATFGFDDITELTHEMETVFDRVRKSQLALNHDLVSTFLASGDMLKSMLDRRRTGGDPVSHEDVDGLCERLRGFLTGHAGHAPAALARPAPPPPLAAVPAPTPAAPAGKHVLELLFGPFDEGVTAKSIDGVIADLADFGKVEEIHAATSGEPVCERRFHIVTEVNVTDMTDALGFMVAPEKTRVTLLDSPAGAAPATAGTAPENGPSMSPQPAKKENDPLFGLFFDPNQQSAPAAPRKPAATPAAAAENSIRVSVRKVDQLVNLVGELVITQAMLAQAASNADAGLAESLLNGIAQLERNTRDLQEAAMSIRMTPMSFAFSRLPRVVRDLAEKLGKEVDLQTVGEGTELDKGLIEHIVDPLTHLVRNSLDHGIEMPDEREANGKPRKGTITLRACHRGGNIIIEVGDDGAGLNRERILAKAVERDMQVSADMSDQEVWQLIFEPGFSTAAKVTDISGRGVGMDVVRRNIREMGGHVDIESALGTGTRISIRLPLTLAILDGMSVSVGNEIFIVPLTYIVESLQPSDQSLGSIAGRSKVVEVRGEYLPIIALHQLFGLQSDVSDPTKGITVILEADGRKAALFVDALVGQHQVVIKSLEANYRKVPGISGATIMGDGRVALILDVNYLVGLNSSQALLAA